MEMFIMHETASFAGYFMFYIPAQFYPIILQEFKFDITPDKSAY